MKRSMEVRLVKQIELWLYVTRHPKGGNRQNYLRTILMLAQTIMGNMQATVGNIVQIRASYGLANVNGLRASLELAAHVQTSGAGGDDSYGDGARDRSREEEKKKGCRDDNKPQHDVFLIKFS